MIVGKGRLNPRPYARLLTMLSEQLIRNKLIALMELIKNSYDADANWVQIRFDNFKNFGKNNLKETEKPFIEIEDDGEGMSFEIIRNSWMNPASPHKYYRRKKGKDITPKGRIIQGEKGIGRYAVYKIGHTVDIFTKRQDGKSNEIYLKTDLSIYDEELLKRVDRKKTVNPIYFDEMSSYYEINDKPQKIIEKKIDICGKIFKRKSHGTLIKITNLKHNWEEKDVNMLNRECKKLVSPFSKTDFTISTTYSGKDVSFAETINLEDILDDALLMINGYVDSRGNCTYKLNKKDNKLNIIELTEDTFIHERFYDKTYKLIRTPECGPFGFKFYVYDFRPGEESVQSHIDWPTKEIIKNHRIYLYRDGVRVYPYGDPDDDWLQLDIFRGTRRAGDYLSNDQVIGYISIFVRDNPNLKDKTNREGLLEIGNAFHDFRALLLGLLGFIKKEFDKLKMEKKKRRKPIKSRLLLSYSNVKKNLALLESHLKTREDLKGLKFKEVLEKEYEEERKLFEDRVEIVEDLAGVGIAVDMASHDLMMMMGRARETLNFLMNMADSKSFNSEKLKDNLDKLYGQFSFIADQLHGIQPLFRSSRRRTQPYRIKEIVEKVRLYYSVPVEEMSIKVNVIEKDSLIIKCPEAVLLQLFINLMDNSVYWLKSKRIEKPEIKIAINGIKCEVIFADNGPGVASGDINYIFDAFFSTKGLKGRGLGLYIARQLLERYDYEINYIVKNRNKILPGANFLINFGKTEED